MDSIINEYFDAAHKGLLAGNAVKPSTLRVCVPTDSGLLVATPDPLANFRKDQSQSTGHKCESTALTHTAHAVATAVPELTAEIARLRERLRSIEAEAALSNAKKESLKRTNIQLAADKASLEQRLEIYFSEASTNVEDCKYWRTRAQEAVKAMSGMRDYHAHEVKLLQRAVLAASGRGQFRISDTAELIERLGRAVIQRDEALRERTKLQDTVQTVKSEFAAIRTDRNRVACNLVISQKKIDRLERINRTLLKGGNHPQANPEEDVSDFERELRGFERRYSVLGEGVAGAEHVMKTQELEIRNLSIRLNICETDNETLRRDVQHWRTTLQSKDEEIAALRRELQDFDKRLSAATSAEAEAADRASRMEKELAKTVVELRQFKETAYSMEQTLNQDAAEHVVALTIYSALDKDDFTNETEVTKPIQLVTHTGEIAFISVVKYEKSGKFAIKATDSDAGDTLYLHLDPDQVDELLASSEEDGEDAWHELMYSVGFARDPVKRLVLPDLLFNETVFLQPADLPLILKLHRYEAARWYVTGFDEILQRVVDLRVFLDESATAEAVADPRSLLKRLTLTETSDENLVLKFT